MKEDELITILRGCEVLFKERISTTARGTAQYDSLKKGLGHLRTSITFLERIQQQEEPERGL